MYKSRAGLPSGVKNNLPTHAQQIYMEAFNSAHKSNLARNNHKKDESSHKIAWSAVKKKYHKTNAGGWKLKSVSG